MATTANGALESIVLDKTRFTCDAESEPEITLPGFTNEMKPNSDGTARVTKKRHSGKIEGLTLSIDVERGDVEFLQELSDKLTLFPFSGTLTNGKVIDGEGQLTGDVKFNAGDGTAEITIEGPTMRIL